MNLLLRFGTAIVLVPGIMYVMWAFNPLGFAAIALLALLVGASEYANIVFPKEGHGLHRLATILSSVLVGGVAFANLYADAAGASYAWLPTTGPVLGMVLVLLSLLFLLWPVDLETAPHRLALAFFGVIYTGLLFALVAGAGLLHAGPAWITMLLMISWLNDTGGYFAGRFLGGKIFANKLYPAVSPKKTWEGFLGGLVGSLLAVVIAKLWFFPLGYQFAGVGHGVGPNLSWLDCVLLAVPAGVIGVAGDLVESMFKRSFHVKDSGAILPGHGGMLDRVDAVLFAAPFLFLYGRYVFDA